MKKTAVVNNHHSILELPQETWLKLCSVVGHDPSSNLGHLGSGMDGNAYLLSNGKVLKITKDLPEAIAATVAKNHPDEHIYTVFKVFEIKSIGMYGILQEHLHKAPTIWRDFAALYSSWDDDNPAYILPHQVEKFCTQMIEIGLEQKYKLQMDWLKGLAKWLMARQIMFRDLHEGNIMGRPDGQVVMIDLGRSKGAAQKIPLLEVAKKLLAAAFLLKRRHGQSVTATTVAASTH